MSASTKRSRIVDAEGARRADLAAIHMAKKALGWDDDHYRDVMFAVCRVRPSGDLDFTGRKRFIAHLQACGWSGARTAPSGRPRQAWDGKRRLVWALWQQLADARLVNDRTSRGLNTWVKRQTGVDRLDWLNEPQLALVIESGKQWLARGGKQP